MTVGEFKKWLEENKVPDDAEILKFVAGGEDTYDDYEAVDPTFSKGKGIIVETPTVYV